MACGFTVPWSHLGFWGFRVLAFTGPGEFSSSGAGFMQAAPATGYPFDVLLVVDDCWFAGLRWLLHCKELKHQLMGFRGLGCRFRLRV